MSIRTMARSSSNRNSASALASSVLPTPVGPRNRNEPVAAQLGGAARVAAPLGPLGPAAQLLERLLELADPLDGALLVLPPNGQRRQLLPFLGQLGAQRGQALLGRRVLLLGQRHLLDLQPAHRPLHRVDLHRP